MIESYCTQITTVVSRPIKVTVGIAELRRVGFRWKYFKRDKYDKQLKEESYLQNIGKKKSFEFISSSSSPINIIQVLCTVIHGLAGTVQTAQGG